LLRSCLRTYYGVTAFEQSGAGRGAQDIFSLADCSLDIPDESPELAKLAKLPRLIAQ
jgi:hypothetical protein